MGRSFHQPGVVNENVLESDFVPRWDGRVSFTSRSQTSGGDVDS